MAKPHSCDFIKSNFFFSVFASYSAGPRLRRFSSYTFPLTLLWLLTLRTLRFRTAWSRAKPSPPFAPFLSPRPGFEPIPPLLCLFSPSRPDLKSRLIFSIFSVFQNPCLRLPHPCQLGPILLIVMSLDAPSISDLLVDLPSRSCPPELT